MASVAPTLRVIRAAECQTMPWKNGGGETTEIAVFPPGAGLDDFVWRVSRAKVASDGPFSVFAGVDRTLTVLEGAGMRLTIGDAEPVDLTPASAPLSFAADVPTRASLLGGAVTDLNVMTRRGSLRHAVTSLGFEPGVVAQHHTAAETVLWLCRSGRLRIEAQPRGQAQMGFELGIGDALLGQGLAASDWRLSSGQPMELFLVEIGTGESLKARERAD